MKFSKGDRIRSISIFFQPGRVGVIDNIGLGNLPNVRVFLDGEPTPSYFNEYELEVVKTGLDVMLELVPD